MKIILKGDEKERKRQEMGIVECDWCHKEFAKKDTKFCQAVPEFVFRVMIMRVKNKIK